MIKPHRLKTGDKVAIVSLSSGVLGEVFAAHELELGERRLQELGLRFEYMPNSRKGIEYIKNHPDARASDLKLAFTDDSIKGIICAIGGDDTYRTIPFLLDDPEFIEAVKTNPKVFLGFSDTTNNHLMFYKLGIQTYYGQEQVGVDRVSHQEIRGHEVLRGSGVVEAELLGGCLESLYESVVGGRYPDQQEIMKKYQLLPSSSEWEGKVLFAETSEEKPDPKKLHLMLKTLGGAGVFNRIRGIIVGKPQDEQFYEEYKGVWLDATKAYNTPIMYNLNFGHAAPRCILPYGGKVEIDFDLVRLYLREPLVA